MELSQKSFIIDISQGPKYANKSRKPFAGDIFSFYKYLIQKDKECIQYLVNPFKFVFLKWIKTFRLNLLVITYNLDVITFM